MGQIVTEGIPADLLAVITNLDGTPATGLPAASVQCQYRKEGDIGLTNKPLTLLNFLEIGKGFYRVNFTALELSVPGSFAFVIFGAGVQTSQNEAQIRSVASTLPTVPVALPTCDISGHINDLAGNPIVGAAISARVLGLPTIETSVGLTDDLLTDVTDENGVFVISLVRLASVEVFIPRINYRRQLVVPNAASADLFLGIP